MKTKSIQMFTFFLKNKVTQLTNKYKNTNKLFRNIYKKKDYSELNIAF